MRPREKATSINSYTKYDIIKRLEINDDSESKGTEGKSKEALTRENYEKLKAFVNMNMTKQSMVTGDKSSHNITFHPPKYENQKRSYYTKEKPIKFHEKATVVKLDQAQIVDIPETPINVDFNMLMAMFENKEEVNSLTLSDLLGFDPEKIGELNEKLHKIIEVINSSSDSNEKKAEVIKHLKEHEQKLNDCNDDVERIIYYLESLESICYGKNENKFTFFD